MGDESLVSQLRSKAVSAHIDSDLVQPVHEDVDRWSINNLLREPIPFFNRSLRSDEAVIGAEM